MEPADAGTGSRVSSPARFGFFLRSMLADVADQDQSVTGSRREGVYFGMLNFGEKIASGIRRSPEQAF